VTARADAGRRVAAWVAERVRDVAPPGLGRWGPAWNIVEDPSRTFLDALARWEATGAAEDQEATRAAAGAVVAAWREAAQQWEAAGRPVVPWTPSEPETAEVGR
jgi:hypothetical protein